ncbi:polyprenyl synthetase family protein [Haladaptatus paucihalophilus]|uniref:Farnesyl-diphosphate synthase n=2 Tax=Haladaptatus paucihalophilus DX253 TaxID=797209 RepID=A0A1M7AVB2_HALPU|nr:polyprenyl synthetase family protein [Haladaptatus paucihalophilus]SHL46728.1 farnesyl-diphosphate synthase [Haladaptatus paucihalophilus DX253]
MEYLMARRTLVEDRLEEVVERVEPRELSEQLAHTALSGGKRVRPTVAMLACEAAGGDAENAVDFGVGIELVHDASLVVDDIIDRSDVRRGTESAWAEYGYGRAIIASDGMLGEAFELFSSDPRAMEVVAESMIELGMGEASELVATPSNQSEYMELARRKTGALFRAAAELGAIAADADPETIDAFGEYAERVGIAFQIRDDVLDATADPDDLGKPTGQDEEIGRPSIVQVTDLSAEEANELAHKQSDAALAALDRVDAPDSAALDYLRDFAEFVVTREH